jgi:CelD/BcsL family acetyltransferase involved in cellulose biosynthesis
MISSIGRIHGLAWVLVIAGIMFLFGGMTWPRAALRRLRQLNDRSGVALTDQPTP